MTGRVLDVSEGGLRLTSGDEVVLDCLFDDRRVWSFHLIRDSKRRADGSRFVPWAPALERYLDGVAQVRIAEHVSGAVWYDAEHRFGSSQERISVTDDEGRPLGIDKSGRMALTFDTRSPEQVAPLLDAIDEVLGALREAGIEAFPAYGTLLGAVREQALIGHDSDADLGYVSKHEHPYEVIRESFELQRRLTEQGYTITRYSGAAFKVDVVESDGSVRGLDVFGGYITGGMLYLMGEVGAPFERSWIYPLGTGTLEGRSLPIPAQPDHLLAAMYGASWRVPDPAFHFETPPATVRRLNGWFRGTRTGRDEWERYYSTRRNTLPPAKPTALARHVVQHEGVPARLVDVGIGRARDALWFARQGSNVVGYDFVPRASTAVQRVAARDNLPIDVRRLNLLELRSVFAEGARISREPGPRTMIAGRLLDSTTRFGRQAFFRFASMALRPSGDTPGGVLYATWATSGESGVRRRPVPIDQVRADLAASGGTLVSIDTHETPQESNDSHTISRMVARWQN